MTEDYKEQLRIPLDPEEVNQLIQGDHLNITLTDDSAHQEIILFKDGGAE